MEILIVSNILLWVLALVNLFLTLALIRKISAMTKDVIQSLPVGQPAPDFSAETSQSEMVSLANYLGREVIFVFVSTTCGTCREVIPQLGVLAIGALRSGVEVVLVIDAEATLAKALIQELNVTLPVLIAPHQTSHFLENYMVSFVPFYVALDPHGKIRASGVVNDPGWHEISGKWDQPDSGA